MVQIIKTAITAILFCGVTLVLSPTASAQESNANDTKTTADKSKRDDYKSPPSPERLAQQNQSRSRTSTTTTPTPVSRSRSSQRSSDMPAAKRAKREMPF